MRLRTQHELCSCSWYYGASLLGAAAMQRVSFGSISKAATCGCSPAGACCVARIHSVPFFASPVLHIFLRAVQQHADARRGAVAYGDAHLLFGRPKMLISALPFAPFFVAP